MIRLGSVSLEGSNAWVRDAFSVLYKDAVAAVGTAAHNKISSHSMCASGVRPMTIPRPGYALDFSSCSRDKAFILIPLFLVNK